MLKRGRQRASFDGKSEGRLAGLRDHFNHLQTQLYDRRAAENGSVVRRGGFTVKLSLQHNKIDFAFTFSYPLT